MVPEPHRPGPRLGDREVESRSAGQWAVGRARPAAAASAAFILAIVGTAAAQEPHEPDDHAAEIEDAQTDQEDPRLSAHDPRWY